MSLKKIVIVKAKISDPAKDRYFGLYLSPEQIEYLQKKYSPNSAKLTEIATACIMRLIELDSLDFPFDEK